MEIELFIGRKRRLVLEPLSYYSLCRFAVLWGTYYLAREWIKMKYILENFLEKGDIL